MSDTRSESSRQVKLEMRALLRNAAHCAGAALLCCACGSTPKLAPAAAPDIDSNRLSFRLFGYSATEVSTLATHLKFRGKVFLVRYTSDPKRIEWIDCPTEASYRYDSGDSQQRDLRIDNSLDLEAKLPLSVATFSGMLAQGNRLRVRFATGGSFQLVDEFTVSNEGECSKATHFIQAITVGAYSIAQESDSAGGGGIDVQGAGAGMQSSSSNEQVTSQGDLSACSRPASEPGEPPKGCQTPIEIMLQEIGDRRTRKPAPVPDGQPAPAADQMPRPVASAKQQTQRPTPRNHANCYVDVTISGRASDDIGRIMERCGAPMGLQPLGKPIVAELAEGQRAHQYPVTLRAGACYRLFAIGDREVTDLDTGLKDPDGNWVVKDGLNDNFPILGPKGPFCVQQAGSYRLLVEVAKGKGHYAMQLTEEVVQH